MEIYLLNFAPDFSYDTNVRTIFVGYIGDLSYVTSFPLALHRFLILTFPNFYHRLDNTKITISFIIIFDLIIILGYFFTMNCLGLHDFQMCVSVGRSRECLI